jgi:16S rRNA (uracil1498-N3)-methyltransferase
LSARRLFAEGLPEGGGALWLGADAARHARVLRLGPGDPLELFDGEGGRAEGRIERVEGGRLLCALGPRVRVPPPAIEVHLVIGLPKAGILDDAVRAATEAGVTTIHLVVAEHSPGRSADERAERRLARLERIVLEAARQCERDHRPPLFAPTSLEAALSRIPEGCPRLLAAAREPGPWPPLASSGARIAVIAVGPEGGFSDAEEAAFIGAGFAAVSLGPHVLRAITAVPVAVALVADRLAHVDRA